MPDSSIVRHRRRVLSIIAIVAFTQFGCSAGNPEEPLEGADVEPTSTISVGVDAEAQVKSLALEDWLAFQWEGEGEPPAPVATVREVSMEESGAVWTSCIEESGFINSANDPQQAAFEFPTDQKDVFDEVAFQCRAKYPLSPKFYQPFNRAQLQALHEHRTGPLTQCLEGQGVTVDAPPSLEKFISDWEGEVSPRWHPLTNVPDERSQEIQDICPTDPENLYDLASTEA